MVEIYTSDMSPEYPEVKGYKNQRPAANLIPNPIKNAPTPRWSRRPAEGLRRSRALRAEAPNTTSKHQTVLVHINNPPKNSNATMWLTAPGATNCGKNEASLPIPPCG